MFSIGGCGKSSIERDTRDSIPPAPASSIAAPKDTIGGADRLQWSLEKVEEVLRKRGFEPVRAGVVRQPFLGGDGVRYQIGEAELQVYLYADAGAVARDTDPLDTARVAPPTMQVTWRMPATLIVDNNIAAILLTRDESLRRRIKAAIEKGHRD